MLLLLNYSAGNDIEFLQPVRISLHNKTAYDIPNNMIIIIIIMIYSYVSVQFYVK